MYCGEISRSYINTFLGSGFKFCYNSTIIPTSPLACALLSHPYSFLHSLPTYLKNPQCGRNRVLLHLTFPSINSHTLTSRPVDTSVNPQLPMTRHVPNQLGYPSESSMEPYRHPSRGPPAPTVHERAYLVSRPNPRIDPHIRPPPRANSAPHVTSNAASSPRRRIPVAVCLSDPLPH
jgi:hypothetical protein